MKGGSIETVGVVQVGENKYQEQDGQSDQDAQVCCAIYKYMFVKSDVCVYTRNVSLYSISNVIVVAWFHRVFTEEIFLTHLNV